jgi:hypothetical protein
MIAIAKFPQDENGTPSHLLRGTLKPMIAIAKFPQDENGTREMTALTAAGLSIDTVKELSLAGFQEAEVFLFLFCCVVEG